MLILCGFRSVTKIAGSLSCRRSKYRFSHISHRIYKKGEILVTKRHPDKTHPNLWECTGGSVLAGEESQEGAFREVKEEIGIELIKSNGKLVKSERRDLYNNFCDIWIFDQSFDLSSAVLQEDEVIDIKWVTRSELDSMYDSGLIVPTLSYYKDIF